MDALNAFNAAAQPGNAAIESGRKYLADVISPVTDPVLGAVGQVLDATVPISGPQGQPFTQYTGEMIEHGGLPMFALTWPEVERQTLQSLGRSVGMRTRMADPKATGVMGEASRKYLAEGLPQDKHTIRRTAATLKQMRENVGEKPLSKYFAPVKSIEARSHSADPFGVYKPVEGKIQLGIPRRMGTSPDPGIAGLLSHEGGHANQVVTGMLPSERQAESLAHALTGRAFPNASVVPNMIPPEALAEYGTTPQSRMLADIFLKSLLGLD